MDVVHVGDTGHVGKPVGNDLRAGKPTELIAIGNSGGAIFPKELLEKLRVSKGDTLTVSETPNGLELSPYDPDFAEAMNLAETIMREDRDVLKKLAQ